MRDPQSGFAEYRPWRDGRARPRSRSWLLRALPLLLACSPAAVELRPAPPVSEPIALVNSQAVSEPELETRSVSVAYHAPAECPGYDAYARHVANRSAHLELEAEDNRLKNVGSVRAQVTLERNDTGWVGHLSLAGFVPPDRQVEGERCEDVVAALALITVLRLERSRAPAELESSVVTPVLRDVQTTPAPRNTTVPAVPESSTPPRAEASGAVAPARTKKPGPSRIRRSSARRVPTRKPGEAEVAAARAAAASRPSVASPRPDVAEPRPPAQRASARQRVGIVSTEPDAVRAAASSAELESLEMGLLGQVGYASVPSHALKLTLGGELRFGATSQSWIMALSFSYARGSAGGSFGEAALSLWSAELDLCPPGVDLTGGLWLQPCAFVRGGVIDVSVAEGDRPLSSIDALRPWLALGPSLMVGLPLSSHFSLRALGQVAFQLVRDRFDSERVAEEDATPERVTLYRPEAMSFELGLGMAYAF
jgi:hypothetical protein